MCSPVPTQPPITLVELLLSGALLALAAVGLVALFT